MGSTLILSSRIHTDESPEAYVTSCTHGSWVDIPVKIHSFATGSGVYGMLVCTLVRGKLRETAYMGGWKNLSVTTSGVEASCTTRILCYSLYPQLYKVYKPSFRWTGIFCLQVWSCMIQKGKSFSCSQASSWALDTPDGNFRTFIYRWNGRRVCKETGPSGEKTISPAYAAFPTRKKGNGGTIRW